MKIGFLIRFTLYIYLYYNIVLNNQHEMQIFVSHI